MTGTSRRARHKGLAILITLLFTVPVIGGMVAWSRLLLHIAAALLFGAWLIALLRAGRGLPATPLDGPLLLVFLACVISTALAVDPRVSLEGTWLLGLHILFYYLAVDRMRQHGSRAVLEPVLFAASLVVLLGLVELAGWYFGLPLISSTGQGWFEIGGWRQPLPPATPRLGGLLFGQPNLLAAYLAMLIPVAAAWAVSTRSRDARTALILFAGGALIVEAATFSRGGFLSLAVSIPALLVLLLAGSAAARARLRRGLRDWRVLAAGATVAAGGALGVWQWAGARDWSVDAARRHLWQAAWRTGLEHPLTGVGPIGYGRALNAVRDPSTLPALLFTPHNVPLMAWAEGGLLGVVALAVLVAAVLRASHQHWRSATGVERVRAAGAFAGLLGLSAHSLVDTFFGAALGTALILPLVALTAYLVAPLEPEPRLPRLRRAAPALVLALVGLAAAGWMVSDVAQHRFTRSLELAAGGDLPAAVVAVESARRLDPAMGFYTAQEAQYLGELAAQDAGYLDGALAAFEAALSSEDSHDVLHANYAALLAQAGDYRAALREMRRAAMINPTQPAYALWSGVYAEELGDRAQALSAYRDALERAPGWVASGFWGLTALRREARQAFLEEHGLQGIPLDVLARTPAPCWPTEGASRWGRVRVTPGAADSYCEAQRALAREEADAAQAARLLDRAAGIQPGLAPVYTARAEAHLALGDLAAAERDARTALFLGDPHGRYRLGQIYEQQGDLDAAERAYLAAVPGTVVMQSWDVGVYQRLGRITYLPQLQAPAPASVEPYLALLRLYETQGRAAEAEQVRQALRAVDPYREAQMNAASLP